MTDEDNYNRTLVPGEIAPAASVAFDVRTEHAPYAAYEVHAQATQKWQRWTVFARSSV
jgi:hypothetical protein